MKQITYRPRAQRTLRRILREMARRILGKIETYAGDSNSQGNNVKARQGRSGIRLRVGDYRVIMADDGEVLDILDIGHRRDICWEARTWA